MSDIVQAGAGPVTRSAGGPAGGLSRHRGVALGLILLAQLLVVIDVSIVTLAIGLAVTITVAAARTTALLHDGHPVAVALTGGFHAAFAVTAGLALAAAAVAAIFIRRAGSAAPAVSPAPKTANQTRAHDDHDVPAPGEATTGGRP